MFWGQLNMASWKNDFFHFSYFLIFNLHRVMLKCELLPQDENSSNHFKSDKKMLKNMKKQVFTFFLSSNVCLLKGLSISIPLRIHLKYNPECWFIDPKHNALTFCYRKNLELRFGQQLPLDLKTRFPVSFEFLANPW